MLNRMYREPLLAAEKASDPLTLAPYGGRSVCGWERPLRNGGGVAIMRVMTGRFWKSLSHPQMMKQKRLKVTAVSKRKPSIQNGCSN